MVGSGLVLGGVGSEFLSKRVKMGLFILLKQDVGIATLMGESHLFVQKRRGCTT